MVLMFPIGPDESASVHACTVHDWYPVRYYRKDLEDGGDHVTFGRGTCSHCRITGPNFSGIQFFFFGTFLYCRF